MPRQTSITRRRFLRRAASAAAVLPAAPYVIPWTALGAEGRAAASERITLAVVGLGGRNRGNLSHFLEQKDVQCVAVCDCFAERRKLGK